jgi:putative membrane protein
MKPFMQKITGLLNRRITATRIFFVIFYIVGIIGITAGTSRDFFISLTPVALLLSLFAVIFYHQPLIIKKEILVFSLICIAGFLVEAAGIRTGRLFGNYTYGDGLGIKVFSTPLLIGINWGLLVYCTAVIVERLPVNAVFKILISSSVMVIYDLIMEQIAPDMNMWSFEDGLVPVKNYMTWFLLAVIFHSLVRLAGIKIHNRIAPFILYVQALFFIILLTFFKLAE